MSEHDLKTWPEPFAAVRRGDKRFEYRLDDRGYQQGDVLVLREWRPGVCIFTGQQIRRRVMYIARGPDFGIPDGFVVMSLEEP